MSNQYKVLAISQWLEKSEYANDVPNQNTLRAAVRTLFDDECSAENINLAADKVKDRLHRKSVAPQQTDAEVTEIVRQFFLDNPLLMGDRRNIDVIGAFIDKNFQGHISRAALDNCLYLKNSELSFRQPAPPPPPAPVVVVPEVDHSRDGLESWQLALDADSWEVAQADVKAVRDLVRRREVRDRAAASKDPTRVGGHF